MAHFIRSIVFLICPVLFLFALCSKDYNPYSDPENCEMHIISKSFRDTDTLNIFSTETVSVLFTAPGLVESFTVESNENRYFENGVKQMIVPGSGPHLLLFSFWDTGLVKISFCLSKINGEKKYTVMNCFVRTLLGGSTASGGFDTLHMQHFKAEGVSDEGIAYEWNFGDFKQFVQINADTEGLFIDGINDTGTGFIYVTDGKFISPASKFSYQFIDSLPPRLLFLDDGVVSGDTLVCSGNDFYKILEITDPGSGKVEEVKINDTSEIVKSKIIKKFRSDIGRISIYMRDGSPGRNDTTIYYYVMIDSVIAGNDGNVQLKILFPGDRDTVNTGIMNVFTQVECLDRQVLHHLLEVKVNNVMVDTADFAEGYFSQRMFTVSAPFAENKIKALLYDRDTRVVIDSAEIITFYDTNYQKDSKPVILDVQFVNTISSRGQVVAKDDSVEVRVIAFDDRGKVEKVFLNSTALVCEKNGYQWSGKVQIPNKFNRDSIIAIDSAGNQTDTLFEVIKNRLPVLKRAIKKKVQVAVGDVYRDTMQVSDIDGDSIIYSISNNDNKNVTIKNQNGAGVIEWAPAITDTNSNGYHFLFSAKDYYDDVIDSVVLFVFKDSADFIAPVNFKTESSEISSVVESGILYQFKLELQKGTNGVTFELRTDMDSVRVSHDTLIVKPQLNDTGYHKVTIIATNKLDSADILYTDFIVVPANRKPLFVDSVFNINGNLGIKVIGVIDSFITFPLNIIDPDSADRYGMKISVSCKLSNVKISLNSGDFFEMKLFNPGGEAAEDTIVLICEDHGGLMDTLSIPVHYLKKVYPVEYITPGDGEYLEQDTVWFRWKKSGNSDDTKYTVQADGVTGIVNIDDTTAFVKFVRSETYVWRVVASSGKDTVVGEWNSFSVRVPGHIQFSTNENELKRYCFAGVDTYSVQLLIKEGTGSTINKFSAILRGKIIDTIPVTQNGMMVWIPKDSDTGAYVLDIIASDSAGNSDTLHANLNVVSAFSCKVNVSCADTSLYCENTVDLYGDVKETRLFIGLTRSGKTGYDTFNIKVTSRGYSVDLDADSVAILLRRPDMHIADDTLVIVAQNKNLNVLPVREIVVVRYNIPTRIVTIDADLLSLTSSLTDVPVLLRLDDKNIGFTKKSGFRFLADDNRDTLDYQINSWDSQNRTAEVWVRFNTIVPSGNNSCVMQYGYQLPDNSNGGAVFDTANNFKCVYHFDEEEKGLIVNDATSGGNDGMFNNTKYDLSNGIGSSILMQEANGTKVTVSQNMVFGAGEEKSFMVESWIKRLQAVNTINYLFTVKIRDSLQCGLLIENGSIKAYYECYDSNLVRMLTKGTGSPIPSSEWIRVSFLVTVLEKQINYITFADNVKVAEGALELPVQSIVWTTGTMILGSKGDVNANVDNSTYNGHWDEIWISKRSRSEDWIRFMFESQKPVGCIVKIQE